MVRKLLAIVKDVMKAFVLGTIAALALAILLLGIGTLSGSNGILSGLEAAKNGMLIFAAAGMFIIAGMLLVKGKQPEKITVGNGWKKHFHVIGYKGVLGTICTSFVILAEIADRLLISYRI